MEKNKTIDTILNHMSIRKWKDEKVSDEMIDALMQVANRTSTSIGMQTASIIRVVDPEVRKKVAEITTQKYVEQAPEFWIFIADNYRINSILEEAGVTDNSATDVDKFFQGFTDAALMAQNVATGVEALGLGFTIFGSILNDAQKLIEVLNLPKYTFPVVGLGFGHPDQDPGLKPRMDYKNRIFTDSYKIYDNYHETFEEYDKIMEKYYDLRDSSKPLESYTKQVAQRYAKPNLKRRELLKVAKKQGYNLEV